MTGIGEAEWVDDQGEGLENENIASGSPLSAVAIGVRRALPRCCRAFAPPAARAEGLEQAKAEVQKAKAKPQFVAPGAPLDITKLKGKHIWIITSTLAVPFVATIAHGVEAAAKVAGLETTLFDGKGQVSEWNRGMAQAVAQHADGIITVGASPELMKGPTGDALEGQYPGRRHLCTADKTAPLVPGTFAHVSISFYHSGQLQADYAIAEDKRQGACADPRRQRISRRGVARRRHAERIPDPVPRLRRHRAGHSGRQSWRRSSDS